MVGFSKTSTKPSFLKTNISHILSIFNILTLQLDHDSYPYEAIPSILAIPAMATHQPDPIQMVIQVWNSRQLQTVKNLLLVYTICYRLSSIFGFIRRYGLFGSIRKSFGSVLQVRLVKQAVGTSGVKISYHDQ